MRVTITIDTDNAAFGNGRGDRARREVLRILRDMFSRHPLRLIGMGGATLRDVNGNTVGEIKVTE